MRELSVKIKAWPTKGEFRISRGALTEIPVVQVEIYDNGYLGRAECRPYSRYGETPESVSQQIKAVSSLIRGGASHEQILTQMRPGAAMNAVDCAFWDLKAKTSGRSVPDLLGLPAPRERVTAFTLSLDTPERTAKAASEADIFPVLKLKIGDYTQGLKTALAVAKARPEASLIIDANEALTPEQVPLFQEQLSQSNTVMIEQPVPTGDIRANLFDPNLKPPICADESLHGIDDLAPIRKAGFTVVNVKLDKCGGLKNAVKLMQAAREAGFQIMAGCMAGSSLALAPMLYLESFADFIDLDGPLLLNDDEDNPIEYIGSKVQPPSRHLWG